jgi:hypothetical protein
MSMDDITKALGAISDIRRQVAQSTEFRGYGPVTLAVTGLFAMLAALIQAFWLPHPYDHRYAYLGIWMTTAFLSAGLIAVHTVTRAHRMHSAMADDMIRMAVEQFLPSGGAGALLTVVFAHFLPQQMWLLPGLWQIIFSLGVFSSCRFLPRLMKLAGAWYLLAGLTCLMLAGNRALSPWTMGVSFGLGQLLVAAILLRPSESAAYDS